MTAGKRPVITLEARTTAHAAELFAVLSDPALYEFIDDEPPASIEAMSQHLSRSESRRSPDGLQHWLNWVVRDEFGRVAGYVQATVESDLQTNVAYVIGRDFHGRGIATQAVRQMMDIVATEFGVRSFRIVAERQNARSLLLASRLGFVPVAAGQATLQGVPDTDLLLHKTLARISP